MADPTRKSPGARPSAAEANALAERAGARRIVAEPPLYVVPPNGLRYDPPPNDTFWAELTAVSTTAYAWREVRLKRDGTYTVVAGGRTGTTDSDPGYEANLLDDVPIGSLVYLHPGYLGDPIDKRFHFTRGGCHTYICVLALSCAADGTDGTPLSGLTITATPIDGKASPTPTGDPITAETGDDGTVCLGVAAGIYEVATTTACGPLRVLWPFVRVDECEVADVTFRSCCIQVCADIAPEPDSVGIGGFPDTFGFTGWAATLSGNGCGPLGEWVNLSSGPDAGQGDCGPPAGQIITATKAGYWDREFCYDPHCGEVTTVSGTLWSTDDYVKCSDACDDCREWAAKPASLVPKTLHVTLIGPSEILGRWAGATIAVTTPAGDNSGVYDSGCLEQSGVPYYEFYTGFACNGLLYPLPDLARPYAYQSCRVKFNLCTGFLTFTNFRAADCTDSPSPALVHIFNGLGLHGAQYTEGCGIPCAYGGDGPFAYQFYYAKAITISGSGCAATFGGGTLCQSPWSGSFCSPVDATGSSAFTVTNDNVGALVVCPDAAGVIATITE